LNSEAHETAGFGRILPLLWAGFLTLIVCGPWLGPGFIFGTDFAGPRYFRFPEAATSYSGLEVALASVATAIPGEVVGKGLVIGILFAAAVGAAVILPDTRFAMRALASSVYVVNPFVYERLAYGQLTVLAGYAVLPLLVASARAVLLRPDLERGVLLAITLSAITTLDVHMAIIGVVVCGFLITAHLLVAERSRPFLRQLSIALISAAALAVAINLYWLVPLLMGHGPEAQTLSAIGASDLLAFRTASDPNLGLLPNVLGLYGFWAERTGRFVSMKDYVPGWPLPLILLLALVCVGSAAALSQRDGLRIGWTRTWTLGLLGACVASTLLEIGAADPHVAMLIGALNAVFPPYRGLRDASKWGAVLALTYSQVAPIGAAVVARSIARRLQSSSFRETVSGLITPIVIAMALFYGNGLLYGLHGQIRPSDYPKGWYVADAAIVADAHPGRALFLPWHGYMSLSFVRNSNPVVANPAVQFFSVPVIASTDLEIPGIPDATGENPDQTAVARLVDAGGAGEWGSTLASHGVKYILIAHELDWASFDYLRSEPGLVLVGDYGSITLYRDLLSHSTT
jgi:hypothetical protein